MHRVKSISFREKIFFLLIISLIPFQPAHSYAQGKITVNFFEFSIESADKEDETIKKHIQNEILKRLEASEVVDEFEFISMEVLKLAEVDKEVLLEETGARFVINGSIEGLRNNKLKIDIELKDQGASAAGAKPRNFSPDVTLARDFQRIESWTESVAASMISIIEGRPMEQVVFTHCFHDWDDSQKDPRVTRLRLTLPIELKETLADKKFDESFVKIGMKYKLKSFDDPMTARVICNRSNEFEESTEGAAYVIYGAMISVPGEEKVQVDLTVRIEESDKYAFIKGFREKLDSENFVQNLADYIIDNWSQIIE